MKSSTRAFPAGLAALLVWAAMAAAPAGQGPTPVRPGFNLFTTEQDVELGRQSAVQVERQVPLVRDPAIEQYVQRIGQRLAAAAPGPKFPYQFRVTNLTDVNAFALPGGFMYVNRGLIELVPTEGQLAGVMAHEMAHVALRHQTNQVSKAYLARAGVGIVGGVLGGGNRSSTGIIQAMGGAGLNALFLKFSRTAESQADIVGAQIMSRAGYDAREMADMFELLRKQAGRDPGRLERFLSDHPAPIDREARVREEAARMPRPAAPRPVGDLVAVKSVFRGAPAPVSMKQIARNGEAGGAPPAGPGPATGAIRIAAPSSQFRAFTPKSGAFTIQYPDNWRPLESPDGAGVTIVPDGGVVQTRGGEPSVVYGVIVNRYAPFEGSIGDRSNAHGPFGGQTRIEDATNDLVRQTTHANPYLAPVRESVRRESVGGLPAISLELVGRSPVTGMEERVRLGTRQQRDGEVIYSLTIAPGRDSAALAPTYERMLASLQPRGGGPRG